MRRIRDLTSIGIGGAAVALLAVVLPTAPAGASAPVATKTVRVTESTSGGALSASSEVSDVDVSENGRFVAFASTATNLITGDVGAHRDVFVTDRLFGTTERVSVSSSEVAGNGDSGEPSISDDGRHVVFASGSSNLGPIPITDANASHRNIFVRDRQAGTTTWLSSSGTGTETFITNSFPTISGDGSKVAFVTTAALVAADTNTVDDVYVRPSTGGAPVQATLGIANYPAGGTQPSLDEDGSMVAFSTPASNVASSYNVGDHQVYRRNLTSGVNELVSISNSSFYGDANSTVPVLSADGSKVLFQSQAENLDVGTDPGVNNVFIRDIGAGTTTLVSRGTDGAANRGGFAWGLSADGSRAVFQSYFTTIIGGATCARFPVLRDRPSSATVGLLNTTGSLCADSTLRPSISANGRYVGAQNSKAQVSDGVDTNGEGDAYLSILADDVFPDVPASHTFFEQVSWLVDFGITTGFDDGTYRPTDAVSRQAIAAFLYRQAGEPAFTPPVTPHFSDVQPDHPFYDEIEWAFAEGIVAGFGDGTFHPTAPVTRQAMASFVYKFAGSPLVLIQFLPTFDDVAEGHPFYKHIGWMKMTGIANGFPDGGFHPTEPVTRQSAASFLFKYAWAFPASS